jgi:hypothetical protein
LSVAQTASNTLPATPALMSIKRDGADLLSLTIRTEPHN